MNAHDLPMVIFTVFTQMAVGTFIALGVIQIVVGRRTRPEVRDRIISPVMYAVGPVMVVGLLVSMLHMNDFTHVFNVFRHPQTSWLSREIMFGLGFAALGFLFALMEWFRWGSETVRQVVAAITALVGIGLVICESMVYYSLVVVPAWHSWMVPLEFFGTTVLLGVLGVSAALMGTTMVRTRHEAKGAKPPADDEAPSGGRGGLAVQVRARVAEINAPASDEEWSVTAMILRWGAVVSAVTAIVLLVAYPLYISQLSMEGVAGEASVVILTGPMLTWRLILLGAVAVIQGVFVYRMAHTVTLSNARVLVTLVIVSLILALTSEMLGRFLHYLTMVRVGI